jgi:hypothetical protein
MKKLIAILILVTIATTTFATEIIGYKKVRNETYAILKDLPEGAWVAITSNDEQTVRNFISCLNLGRYGGSIRADTDTYLVVVAADRCTVLEFIKFEIPD